MDSVARSHSSPGLARNRARRCRALAEFDRRRSRAGSREGEALRISRRRSRSAAARELGLLIGDQPDRYRRPACREPPQAAAHRRHGFDHDRPGMHRRTGQPCRRRRAHQGDHRRAMRGELDFEGALKARLRLLKGLPEAAIATILRSGSLSRRADRTLIATMKAQRRLCRARLRRLHPVHRPCRRAPRLRRASRQ